MPDPSPDPRGAAPTGTQFTDDGPGTVPPDAFPFLDHPQQPDELGRLGPYRVLGVLGRGGMGVVFAADEPALGRRVALKAMLPQFAHDQHARTRFVREAKAQAAVEHDHVAAIFAVGEAGGVPFLAMPLLKGMTLADALKTGVRCPVQEALRVAREMAEGLAAAHGTGLIHRDIKPANVWLEGGRRRVKILDFGLARAADADGGDDPVTASGAVLGTPAYMSPEQANGYPLDARTDLFSLGTVLYELLAGRRPFQGATTPALLVAVAYEVPPPPSAVNREVPPALDGLVGWLMAKDPAARPPAADVAAGALRTAEAELERAQAVASASVAVALPDADPWAELGVTTTAAGRPATVAGRPKPWLLAGGVAALAAVLAAGVVVFRGANTAPGVAESRGPDDGKPVGDGKPAAIKPTKPEPLPPLSPVAWKPVPVGGSPFDKLDPREIPDAERADGPPNELVAVVGTGVRRMWGRVSSLAVSPDGKLAATGCSPGRVVLWEVDTQRLKGVVLDRTDADPKSLQFTADGTRLVVGWQGNGVWIECWDLSGDRPRQVPFAPDDAVPAYGVPFFPEELYLCEGGRTLVACSHGSYAPRVLCAYDLSGGRTARSVAEFVARDLVVAAGAGVVVFVTEEGTVRRAELRAGKLAADEEVPIPLGEAEAVRAVSPDGKRLVVAGDGQLRLWDLTATPPRPAGTIREHLGDRLEISPDGRWLSSGAGPKTALWRIDAAEPKFAGLLDESGGGYPAAVRFRRDGGRAVVGNAYGVVRFWDLSGDTPAEPSPFDPATAVLTAAAGAGELVVSDAAPALRHKRWDLTGPRPVRGPGFDAGSVCGPVAGGRWLVGYGGWETPLGLFRFDQGRWGPAGDPFGRSPWGVAPPGGGTAFCVTESPGAGFELEAWDLTAPTPARKWAAKNVAGGHGWYNLVSCSADGRVVTAGRQRGADAPAELVVWRNLDTRAAEAAVVPLPLDHGPGHYRGALSPNGHYLAHRKQHFHEVVLEDVSKPKPAEVGRVAVRNCRWLAFHPDGRTLAVASAEGVRVLDLPALKPLWVWKAPGDITRCDWAADGRHLVTLNGNKTVYVFRFNDLK